MYIYSISTTIVPHQKIKSARDVSANWETVYVRRLRNRRRCVWEFSGLSIVLLSANAAMVLIHFFRL